MSQVDQDLIPGEEVVYRAKVGGNFGETIFFLIFITPVYFIPSEPEMLGNIRFALLVILGIWAINSLVIRSITDEFVVTSKRIIDKRGFFGSKAEELNLDKVESVIVEQSLIGKLLGEGRIIIKGAGMKDEHGHAYSSVIIKKPNVFKQKVYGAIESLK